MPGGQPGVPLHRNVGPIGQIVLTYGIGQGTRGSAAATAIAFALTAHVTDAHRGITVPAQRYEDIFRYPAGYRHGRALERSDRTGPAHMHRDRIAQVLDAKVGGKMFGG